MTIDSVGDVDGKWFIFLLLQSFVSVLLEYH